MKNLEIFLHDNTKVFEAVISNNTGIMAIHKKTIMPSLKELIGSVIKGTYKIEFEDSVLDTSLTDSTFDRIELFKASEDFIIKFDTVTPLKILDYVYGDYIPYNKELQKIANFFNISLNHLDDIPGIGEALYEDGQFVINCKLQLYPQRKRFTIAHELGHIFLHFATDKSKHFIDYDDELKASNNTSTLKAARNDITNHDFSLEEEANTFASELLIPREQLKHLIDDWDCTRATKPKISYLKSNFNVSAPAMYYAIKNADLLQMVDNDTKPYGD